MSRFQNELAKLLSNLIKNRLCEMIIPIDLLDTQLVYDQIVYDKVALNEELRRIITSDYFSISLRDNININIVPLVDKIKEILSYLLKDCEIINIKSRKTQSILNPNLDIIIYKYDTFFFGQIEKIIQFDVMWRSPGLITYIKEEQVSFLGSGKTHHFNNDLLNNQQVIYTHKNLIIDSAATNDFIVFIDTSKYLNIYRNGIIFEKKLSNHRFKFSLVNHIPYVIYLENQSLCKINLITLETSKMILQFSLLSFDFYKDKFIVATQDSVYLIDHDCSELIVKLDNYVRILELEALPDGFVLACSDNALRIYNPKLQHILNTNYRIADLAVLVTHENYKIISMDLKKITVWY